MKEGIEVTDVIYTHNTRGATCKHGTSNI